MDGEIIIYDVDANYSYKRLKIGDGKTNVNQLPFLKDKSLEDAISNKANASHEHSDYHITVDVGKHHPWTGKLPSVLDEISEAIDGKSPVGHGHVIGDIKNLSQTIDSLQNGIDSVSSDIEEIRNGSITVAEATHATTADSATDAHNAVNATNAVKASQLATARTISLTGDATGSVSFDGTQNVSLTVTVADDSHNHIISNIDGLQDALNSKSDSTHGHKLADLTADSTHRVVTDAQISSWNAKSNFSGSYTDLTSKPTLGSLAAKSTVAKTDLASDVQTSLGKADTALTDAKAYTDAEVAKKADALHRHESADVTIDIAFKDDSVLGNAVTVSDALLAIDSEFNNKADVNHNHNNQYDAKGAASDALASAKTYADNTDKFNAFYFQSGVSTYAGDAMTGDGKESILASGNDSITFISGNDLINFNVYGHDVEVMVNADPMGSADAALEDANKYTDNKIALLMNNSSAAVDSIMELATAMEENADVVEALESAIGTKSDKGHVHVADYTPSGSISGKFTGTSATSNATSETTSVYSITDVGSLPTMTANVTNRCLTFSFNAGSVPTRSSVSVPSASHTHNVTATGNIQATFIGSPARI